MSRGCAKVEIVAIKKTIKNTQKGIIFS